MPQQKGVKRAAKVAARKRKIEIRRKESNINKMNRAHEEHDHQDTEETTEK